MKCPLFVAEDPFNNRREDMVRADCLEEECHWWSLKFGRCAILGYLDSCDRAAKALEGIKAKLKPELFRSG